MAACQCALFLPSTSENTCNVSKSAGRIFAMYLKVQANICNVSTSAEYLPHICKCTILAVYLQVQDICNAQDLFSEQSRSLLPLSGPQPQASSASVLERNFLTITR